MYTQLSLNIEEDILHDAEKFAQMQGKSIDAILTEFLESLANIQRTGGFLPIVEQMIGIAEPEVRYEDVDAKWEYLRKKYLEI